MPQKLTENKNVKTKNAKRLDRSTVKFKICIDNNLHNKYSFENLKGDHLKAFQQFLNETTGKNLTISNVDKLFLRTKGKVVREEIINGVKRDVIHYGKARKPMRIFGFYEEKGYFVIFKIDPEHEIDG